MKANRLYRDIMKRLSTVPMPNRTREGAQVELRRAVSMIEFLLGKRKVETGTRQV